MSDDLTNIIAEAKRRGERSNCLVVVLLRPRVRVRQLEQREKRICGRVELRIERRVKGDPMRT